MNISTTVLSALPVAALLATPAGLTGQSQKPFTFADHSTHWYSVVAAPAGITWAEANRAAAAAGGYLATIATTGESGFVFSLIDDPKYWTQDSATGAHQGPWLGGVQRPNAGEPGGGWGWATLQPFGFTNWTAGKPDDANGADRIHFGGSSTGRVATWSDAPAGAKRNGYVIEYSGATSPRTVGLQTDSAAADRGYTLFAPRYSKDTYLLDSRGRVAHTWISSYYPGLSAYLLADGSVLRAGFLGNDKFMEGGAGGVIEIFEWSGGLAWSFRYSSPTFCHHHDTAMLPNGNILLIAWELKSKTEAVAAGRDPELLTEEELWPDTIIEVKPDFMGRGGSIVWEWHAWDHLVQDFDRSKANYGDPAQHPELFDVNYTINGASSADWQHCNAVAYNAKLDQIVISSRAMCEIWVIDHSTTTAQASGHSGGRSGKGGDILYRWGNPEAYRAGTAKDRKLFYQHDAHWIDDGLPGAGNILVFNNGPRATKYSTVDEILLPVVDAKGNYPRSAAAWGPAKPTWTYQAPTKEDFYSGFISGAQRLKNGNTLVCGGAVGQVFEVLPSGQVRWRYGNPYSALGRASHGAQTSGNLVFRAPRYAADHPGLKGRTLIAGDPLELYPETTLLVEGSTAPCFASVGTTVRLTLHTPRADGEHYQFASALGSGSIPIDHRFIPLAADPLLAASLANSAPTTFESYFGTLDDAGRAHARIKLPNFAALAGLQLHTACVVLNPASPSGIVRISNTAVVTVVK